MTLRACVLPTKTLIYHRNGSQASVATNPLINSNHLLRDTYQVPVVKTEWMERYSIDLDESEHEVLEKVADENGNCTYKSDVIRELVGLLGEESIESDDEDALTAVKNAVEEHEVNNPGLEDYDPDARTSPLGRDTLRDAAYSDTAEINIDHVRADEMPQRLIEKAGVLAACLRYQRDKVDYSTAKAAVISVYGRSSHYLEREDLPQMVLDQHLLESFEDADTYYTSHEAMADSFVDEADALLEEVEKVGNSVLTAKNVNRTNDKVDELITVGEEIVDVCDDVCVEEKIAELESEWQKAIERLEEEDRL